MRRMWVQSVLCTICSVVRLFGKFSAADSLLNVLNHNTAPCTQHFCCIAAMHNESSETNEKEIRSQKHMELVNSPDAIRIHSLGAIQRFTWNKARAPNVRFRSFFSAYMTTVIRFAKAAHTDSAAQINLFKFFPNKSHCVHCGDSPFHRRCLNHENIRIGIIVDGVG